MKLNRNKVKSYKKDVAPFLSEVAESYCNRGREYIMKKVFGKHLYEIDLILQNIKNDKAKILDIGGGLGTNLQTIRKMYNNLSLSMIDKFEEYLGDNSLENPMGTADVGLELLKNANVNCTQEDFFNKPLPYTSDTFDVVTCFDVVEHFIDNPLLFFGEVKRVLVKNGTFIMCAPNLLSTARRGRLLFGHHPYMHFDMWMKEKYDKYYGHFREYTRKEYQILLERASFTQIKTYMVSEPTRTKAYNSYHHEQYRRFSLPAFGLWIMYIIEILFPNLRTEVYCTAQKESDR